MSIADPNAPMTALVEYQVRTDEATVSEWLNEWQKRAQDAFESEPKTTTYASAFSFEDESRLFFFEHYENGWAGLKAHLERPSHAALNGIMSARRMTKRKVMGTGFFDLPNFGWRGRNGGEVISDRVLFDISGLRFGCDASKSEGIRLLHEYLARDVAQETEILMVSGGVTTRDADRCADIKRGDLILAMASFNSEAMEAHILQLGERLIDAGIEVTPSFKKKYRTTGHGFLLKNTCCHR